MPIRVLVVDDSAFMRKTITDILESDPNIKVIGVARNGIAAVEKARELEPDVITLDVQMPEMDGIEALTRIMIQKPTRVLMLSSVTRHNSEETIKALRLGAIDFITKPSGAISLDISKLRDDIISKVKVAANARLVTNSSSRKTTHILSDIQPKKAKSYDVTKPSSQVIVIGCSTGGPSALFTILPDISPTIEAGIIIVQHMPPGFTASLAKRLDSQSSLTVKEAETGDTITNGMALLAPGGYHLTVVPPGKIAISGGPCLHGVKPAIDITMKTVVEVYKSRVIGVILTGMGFDGSAGMAMIKQAGGHTIVENETSCVVYGMPRVVVEMGNADVIAPLENIAENIASFVKRRF